MSRRDDFQREVLDRLRAIGGSADLFAETAGKPIADAVAAFLEDVKRGTATTRSRGAPCVPHVRRVGRTVRLMVQDCGWQTVGELNGKQALRWLAGKGDDWSPSTRGVAKVLVRLFGSWLVREGWLASNPFELLACIPSKGEPTFLRGALQPQHVSTLIGLRHEAARAGALRLILEAFETEVAYLLGSYAGLRLNEVLTLRVGDLALAGDNPAVLLRSAVTKNRKAARIELPAHVAAALRRQVARLRRARGELAITDRALPLLTRQLTRTMQADLIVAGLARHHEGRAVNANGEALDFHALRVSFGTWLIASGVSPVVAQRLLRHADVRLTLTTYARIPDGALRAAADALPLLPRYLPAASFTKTGRRDAADA